MLSHTRTEKIVFTYFRVDSFASSAYNYRVITMEEDYQQDLIKIEKTVQDYVDGVIGFNFKQAEGSWHPKGVKIIHNKSTNELNLITLVQSRPEGDPPEGLIQQAEIKEINRVGQAATVILQWYQQKNQSETIFTDFISLLKIQDQWKIVAKVSDVKKIK